MGNIVEQLSYLDLAGRPVYVYGLTSSARQACHALLSIGMAPAGVLDRNSGCWGQRVFGVPVLNPATLSAAETTGAVALITALSVGPITQTLLGLGFGRGNIHVLTPEDQRAKSNAPPPDFTRTRTLNGVRVGRYSHDVGGLCGVYSPVRSIGAFCSVNGTAMAGMHHPLHFIVTSGVFYVDDANPLLRNSAFAGAANELDPFRLVKPTGQLLNGPTVIGNDVWIGQYATIMPNISIGNGAVVGAGAVVTKDVPAYAIVAGVPAKVLGYRFTDAQIRVLQNVQWWEWPEGRIIEEKNLLRDPELFFQKYG